MNSLIFHAHARRRSNSPSCFVAWKLKSPSLARINRHSTIKRTEKKTKNIILYIYIYIHHTIIKQEKKKKEKNTCHLNPIQMNHDRIREWRVTVTWKEMKKKKKKKLMRQTINDNFTFARNKLWHNPVNDSRVDASLPVNGADPLALGDVQGMFHSRQNIHFPCEPWLTHLLHSVRFSVWPGGETECVRARVYISVLNQPRLYFKGRRGEGSVPSRR